MRTKHFIAIAATSALMSLSSIANAAHDLYVSNFTSQNAYIVVAQTAQLLSTVKPHMVVLIKEETLIQSCSRGSSLCGLDIHSAPLSQPVSKVWLNMHNGSFSYSQMSGSRVTLDGSTSNNGFNLFLNERI